MFCAEDIASDSSQQQQNHVYNLLDALKNLSADKQRRQDVNSTALVPPNAVDKSRLT